MPSATRWNVSDPDPRRWRLRSRGGRLGGFAPGPPAAAPPRRPAGSCRADVGRKEAAKTRFRAFPATPAASPRWLSAAIACRSRATPGPERPRRFGIAPVLAPCKPGETTRPGRPTARRLRHPGLHRLRPDTGAGIRASAARLAPGFAPAGAQSSGSRRAPPGRGSASALSRIGRGPASSHGGFSARALRRAVLIRSSFAAAARLTPSPKGACVWPRRRETARGARNALARLLRGSRGRPVSD